MSSGPQSLYAVEIEVVDISGVIVPMRRFRGQVLLIVNVASRCGYTPQYAALEALHRKHRDAGLTVLGFPCDQFGHQESATEAEIRAFCSLHYDVTFPLFSKIEVNGNGAHPLYRFLKARQKGVFGSESVKWNFTKFLVGRDGHVLKRYGPTEAPASIEPDIVAALSAGVVAPV